MTITLWTAGAARQPAGGLLLGRTGRTWTCSENTGEDFRGTYSAVLTLPGIYVLDHILRSWFNRRHDTTGSNCWPSRRGGEHRHWNRAGIGGQAHDHPCRSGVSGNPAPRIRSAVGFQAVYGFFR